MTSSLIVRKHEGGGVSIVGQAPEEHIFPLSWFEREVPAGTVSVFVRVNTTEGEILYEMTGFPTDEESGNTMYSGIECRKVIG